MLKHFDDKEWYFSEINFYTAPRLRYAYSEPDENGEQIEYMTVVDKSGRPLVKIRYDEKQRMLIYYRHGDFEPCVGRLFRSFGSDMTAEQWNSLPCVPWSHGMGVHGK